MMFHSHAPMHGHGCSPCLPVRCCRKEAKELLVGDQRTIKTGSGIGYVIDKAIHVENQPGGQTATPPNQQQEQRGTPDVTVSEGIGEAIIGGGCCVQLSIEYMPANFSLKDQNCKVAIAVQDSEGAYLLWEKQFKEGYHVKECVITTYPGAKLKAMVSNAVARVRWCEIFSC